MSGCLMKPRSLIRRSRPLRFETMAPSIPTNPQPPNMAGEQWRSRTPELCSTSRSSGKQSLPSIAPTPKRARDAIRESQFSLGAPGPVVAGATAGRRAKRATSSPPYTMRSTCPASTSMASAICSGCSRQSVKKNIRSRSGLVRASALARRLIVERSRERNGSSYRTTKSHCCTEEQRPTARTSTPLSLREEHPGRRVSLSRRSDPENPSARGRPSDGQEQRRPPGLSRQCSGWQR